VTVSWMLQVSAKLGHSFDKTKTQVVARACVTRCPCCCRRRPHNHPSLRNHRPCIVTGMPGGDVRLLRAGARGRAVLHGQHGRVEFR
jgi:hypothetical protein